MEITVADLTTATCASCDWDGNYSECRQSETGRTCPNCGDQALKYNTPMTVDLRALMKEAAQTHPEVAAFGMGFAIASGALMQMKQFAIEASDGRILRQLAIIGY